MSRGDMNMTEKLLRRAAEVAAALADASEAIGRSRPEMVDVGPYRLAALSADKRRVARADQAVAGLADPASPQPRRERGGEVWDRKVNAIKFGFVVDLAAAWRATGNADYVEAARDWFEDFLDYFGDEPYSAQVRMAGRVRHWLGALPYFLDSDVLDDDLIDRILASMRLQLNHLAAAEKGPGNVRLMTANTFVKARLLLPFVPESQQWMQQARNIYRDAAHRDIEPDGSHIEHDPHYHNAYQGAFENLLLWSRAFPQEELPAFPAIAARIFDYAAASRRPNGEECGMQDGVGAWTGGSSPEAVLARRAAVRRLAGLDEQPPPPAQVFPDAGHVFMRTGWDADAQYVTFDATRWGGGHSHLARNAIQLQAFGRMLVTDPGFFSYWMQHSARHGSELDNRIGPYAKSTPAHNTLNLNGWNQAPTNPDLLKACFGDGCHAVVSRYSGGYWPGWYGWWFQDGFGPGVRAVHDRILIWLPGRAAVVVDTILRWDESALGGAEQRDPTLEMNWQLTPGAVELDAEAKRLVTANEDANVLMLFPRLPENMTLEVKEGQMDPFRGWVGTGREAAPALRDAGVFDAEPLSQWRDAGYAPAPQVCGTASPMSGFGATLVTVLVPFRGRRAPDVTAEVGGVALGEHIAAHGTGTVTLQWADGVRDHVAWTPVLRSSIGQYAPDGSGEAVRTDAAVLHLGADASGRVTRGAALDATYCEPFAPERRDAPGAITLNP
ncbi:MAG: heparinase II/III family protein [Planctomycetota bacterium]